MLVKLNKIHTRSKKEESTPVDMLSNLFLPRHGSCLVLYYHQQGPKQFSKIQGMHWLVKCKI